MKSLQETRYLVQKASILKQMEYELDAYDASLEVRTLDLRFVRGLAHITCVAYLE